MSKKINPRRKPATQADVDRAKRQAADEAMSKILYLILYVLIDKHDAPKEDLLRFAAEINYAADSIAKGYVTWKDIERVVRVEYDVHLPWG